MDFDLDPAFATDMNTMDFDNFGSFGDVLSDAFSGSEYATDLTSIYDYRAVTGLPDWMEGNSEGWFNPLNTGNIAVDMVNAITLLANGEISAAEVGIANSLVLSALIELEELLQDAHVTNDSPLTNYGDLPDGFADVYDPDIIGTDGFYVSHGEMHCPSDVPELLGGIGTALGFTNHPAGVAAAALFWVLSVLAPSHDHCTGSGADTPVG